MIHNTRLARAALKAFVRKFSTHRQAAHALGISDTQMSELLRGRRPLSPALLAKLGLKCVIERVIVRTSA